MSSPLQWIFQLVDRISAPASAMAKSVDSYEKAVKSAGASQEHFGASMSQHATHFALVTEGVNLAFDAVAKLTEKMAELGLEFGMEALKAADFERSTRIAFTALLGSSKAAEEAINGAKSFALEAGTPLKETIQAYKNLALAGVSTKNTPIIFQAATDIANIKGEGAGGALGYAQAFADIQSRGQLAGRALMQFKGVLNFDVLAQKLGVAKGGFAALQKQLETTPVSAAKGIKAILETLAQAEGGKIGQVTKDIGQGWEGSVQKMRTAWDLLLGKLEDSAGFKNILVIINRVAAALDPTSESGKRLGEVFETLFAAVSSFLEPLNKPGGVEAFSTKLADFASTAISVTAVVVGLAGDVISGWSQLISFFENFGEFTTDIWTGLKFTILGLGYDLLNWGRDLWVKFKDMGRNLVLGLVDGVIGAIDLATGAVGRLADGVIGKFRSVLRISSPSGVMRDLGLYTAEGFSQGLDRGGLSDSLALRMPEAPAARGASGAGGGITVQVHQEFNITASHGVDLEELAHRIAEIGQGGLQSALEQLGLSMGTVVPS